METTSRRSSMIREDCLIVQTSTGKLRALELDDLRRGPVVLRTVGNLPPDNQSQWHLFPADGCWYTYVGNGGKQHLQDPTARGESANGHVDGKHRRNRRGRVGIATSRSGQELARSIAQDFSTSGRSAALRGLPADVTR